MQPVTEKRWKIREADEEAVRGIASECSLSIPVARVLVNRGIAGIEAAAGYLNPTLAGLHEPLLMLDMDRGVERLATARMRGESVCIYGDYDVLLRNRFIHLLTDYRDVSDLYS